MFWFNLALLAYFATVQGADHHRSRAFRLSSAGEVTVDACKTIINRNVIFCTLNQVLCLCTNELSRATLAGCFLDNGKYNRDTVDYAIEWCSSFYNRNVTREQWDSALALYKAEAVPLSEKASYKSSKGLITRPIKFPKETTSVVFKSYSRYYFNYNASAYYGFGLLGYWVLVLIGFAVNNWAQFLFPLVFVRSNDWFKSIRAHVFKPALYRRKQQVTSFGGKIPGAQIFQILAPSRIESLAILGFFLLCFVFLSVDIAFIPGDPVMKFKSAALEKYLADRSGIIATINIPLLILFGGRNNFLQWLTGVNFATMITFHKWMARVFIVMVIIHSVTYSFYLQDDYKRNMKDSFLIWGTLGTVAGGLIFAQSILYLRRKAYEVFLVVHIILAAAFVMGAWKHVEYMGYVAFTYAAVAIWSVDRIVRIGRLTVFGFPKIDVQLISGIIKIQIPTRTIWKPTVGGFAYLYFILTSKFFQSHPYSYLQLPNQINFYIKVKAGISKTLEKELLSLPDLTKNMRLSVEGPYGGGLEGASVDYYHRAVFIAGGNGIPGVYGAALHSKNPKVIWIIRDYSSLNWFWEELKLLVDMEMEIDVYVTKASDAFELRPIYLESESAAEKNFDVIDAAEIDSRGDSESEDKESKEKSSDLGYNNLLIGIIKRAFPHVNFIHARPAIQELVSTELLIPGLSFAFVACGHPEMVDEIRAEVSKGHKEKRVDFYEHSQTWA